MKPAILTAVTILGAFAVTVLATWGVRNWLEKGMVLDKPNERSLHETSTVTGGGLAISMVLVGVFLCLTMVGFSASALILIPIVAFTAIGFLDDVYNVIWFQKLLMQLAVAGVFVATYGSFSELDLFGVVLKTGWMMWLVSVVWIVGFVNIYNFMDGIDGLAGSYGALCACVLGVWLVLLGDQGLSLFLFGLMAACLGFLVWNWSPASIFLGDAGSMMLGGALAAASIVAQREYDVPFGALLLLYAVFISDAAYTLVRRAVRGEKVWQAHREHFYQRAVRSGLTHPFVTGVVLFISLIICVFATLEMQRIGPRISWLALTLLIMAIAIVLVKKRETQAP